MGGVSYVAGSTKPFLTCWNEISSLDLLDASSLSTLPVSLPEKDAMSKVAVRLPAIMVLSDDEPIVIFRCTRW